MKFAILRLKKHHQKGTVAAASAHLTRERECPNADPTLSKENRTWAGGQTVARIMSTWNDRLGTVDRKVRADAVTCVEYVMTYSPGALDEKGKNGYFKAAIAWLEKRHGKENILTVVEHVDERTPHLHALVVPIRKKTNAKGREVVALAAKDLCHGRATLSAMQDDFYLAAGKAVGLDRGRKGSRAHHQTIRGFYANISRVGSTVNLPILTLPEKDFLEGNKAYLARAQEAVNKQGFGYMGAIITSRELRAPENAQRAQDAEKDAREARREAEAEKKAAEAAKNELWASKDLTRTEITRVHAELTREREKREKAEIAYREAQAKREAHVKFIVSATPEEFRERQAQWRKEIAEERDQGRG